MTDLSKKALQVLLHHLINSDDKQLVDDCYDEVIRRFNRLEKQVSDLNWTVYPDRMGQ